MLRSTLGVAHTMVLHKCMMSCIHHYVIIQSVFFKYVPDIVSENICISKLGSRMFLSSLIEGFYLFLLVVWVLATLDHLYPI